MKAYVNIGDNSEFTLAEAVLVYRGGGDGAFASLHKVKQAERMEFLISPPVKP